MGYQTMAQIHSFYKYLLFPNSFPNSKLLSMNKPAAKSRCLCS